MTALQRDVARGTNTVTLGDVVARAKTELQQLGIPAESAALDAELLARHVLGWDRATWLARRSEEIPPEFVRDYTAVVGRRKTREPVAYIRGTQEFWGREFRVTPAVLIPRPETEIIIEAVEPLLRERPTAVVVDVGTGSGCLAVTIALEHPHAIVYATDVSREALSVARDNAARLGTADRIRFMEGAYLADAPSPVDIIVSNPPYVARSSAAALPPEVREYEPHVALFGSDRDGLAEIGTIISEAARTLAPGGWLVMEIGCGQGSDIEQIVATMHGLVLDSIRGDLQGIPRTAMIRRVNAAE